MHREASLRMATPSEGHGPSCATATSKVLSVVVVVLRLVARLQLHFRYTLLCASFLMALQSRNVSGITKLLSLASVYTYTSLSTRWRPNLSLASLSAAGRSSRDAGHPDAATLLGRRDVLQSGPLRHEVRCLMVCSVWSHARMHHDLALYRSITVDFCSGSHELECSAVRLGALHLCFPMYFLLTHRHFIRACTGCRTTAACRCSFRAKKSALGSEPGPLVTTCMRPTLR